MNIMLVCNAGMSTGMLAKKMEKFSEGKCTVKAYGIAEYMDHLENVDIILVGPQIRFQYEEIKDAVANIPVLSIDPIKYGSMNAEAILNTVYDELGGENNE
ncbi:PTS system, cellobiose-specific IIB component [Clostridium cavendishii DSM 21758]|uniref:PTS system, cellobiose-specific IIB component n=1 Tax=Clostridium cavendishii DSM 21758 TaxID=1121302 RepID=A0A1M6R3K1_9CLOT|nr:PTS sugar transporter subunit IIB [Clostridium cavendishii]SHK26917.1 PTS system, cellobiose-specific IIB component [Clostridium cavendishii DSM 21758]